MKEFTLTETDLRNAIAQFLYDTDQLDEDELDGSMLLEFEDNGNLKATLTSDMRLN